MLYNVWSLDVWGHHGSECCEAYGCPCVDGTEHDDDRCDCHFEVNDRCKVGTVEIADDEDALVKLDAEGFIHSTLCDIDDWGDGTCFDIVSKDTGRPLLQLEEVMS